METVILSDDPELVLAAIEGLAGVRDVPRLQHLAAARGLHFIESHPERALECLKLLRSYDEALVPLAAEWARLTHSDHLDVRAAAISILAKISWYPEQVDPVHRQILISVAESEHIINDDRTARWFRTRIRNLVRHGAWSTTH